VDSIIDNRLFDQLQDLNDYVKPILLIEGRNIYSQRNIDEKAVRGALSSVALDYGIPIIWSKDEEDTSRILMQIAEKEQIEKEKDVQVRANASGRTLKQQKEFIVAGLPGVNTKIARRLLDQFSNIDSIFSATEEELQEVEGLGEKKASSIRSILDQEY